MKILRNILAGLICIPIVLFYLPFILIQFFIEFLGSLASKEV